jgi:ComF family protein
LNNPHTCPLKRARRCEIGCGSRFFKGLIWNLLRVSGFGFYDAIAVNVLALANHFADFCYPPICNLCGAGGVVPPLCADCTADLDRLASAAACGGCGFPLVSEGDPCPRCRGRGIGPVKRVARLGVFSDPLRDLVHRLKFRNGWPLAEFLADRLAAHAPAKVLLDEADCLVAVPLHPMRQWARGYNQAAVIAQRLKKISGIPIRTPLVRLRNTAAQSSLRAQAKRWENVRDAFGLIDAKSVRGRHVVLVDDVMTTGATLKSAARTLRKAEPASISVIAIAVADPKGRAYQFI